MLAYLKAEKLPSMLLKKPRQKTTKEKRSSQFKRFLSQIALEEKSKKGAFQNEQLAFSWQRLDPSQVSYGPISIIF